MSRRNIGWISFGLWALVYLSSIIVLVDFSGEGRLLGRSLSRVSDFVAWQIGAGFIAIVVWWFGGAFEKKTFGRRVFRIPAFLALVPVVLWAGLVVGANFQRPPPEANYPAPVGEATQIVPPVNN